MPSSLAVLALALVVLGGCQLKKDRGDCVSDPGMTTDGSTLCSQPPPSQFDELGQ